MHVEILKELVREVAGKNSEGIIDILLNKKEVNEYKIADKLKLTINQTRSIFYKLYANSIVSFSRKKDRRKGWYNYSWALNIAKALEKFSDFKKREILDLQHQIASRQNKHFYICPNNCTELNEENALLHNFLCPECGQLLKIESPKRKLEDINAKIEEAKKSLAIAEQELAKITEKETKKTERKIKKEKKERKERLREKLKKRKGKTKNKKIKKTKKLKKKTRKLKKLKKLKKSKK